MDSTNATNETACTHHCRVSSAAGDTNGTLCNCRQHLFRGKDGGNVLSHVQTLKASKSKQGSSTGTLVQLSQPCLHVAAEIDHLMK